MSTKRKQRGRAETRQPLRLASLDPPAPQPPNRAAPTVLLDPIIILSRSHDESWLNPFIQQITSMVSEHF